jgi:hypothetical protein
MAACNAPLSPPRLTLDRCNGFRCSLANNVLSIGFVRAPSLSHALMARSSSLWSGCVVYSPFLNGATCSMDLPFSTARLNPSIWDIRRRYLDFVSSFG